MVRKLMALFALVLALGMTVMPAAAQDVSVDEMQDFGLVSGYFRMYMGDPSAATPSPLLGVMVGGFEFDTADNASTNFEDFTCGFVSGFVGLDATDCAALADGGITVADVDGMGDQAIEATGEADINGPTPVTMLAVQHENHIFMVIHLGMNEPGAGDAIAKFLVDAEPSDTEVMFNEDGTSTGGFFDMLPQAGDAEIDGLMPLLDMDMFGSTMGTPAA